MCFLSYLFYHSRVCQERSGFIDTWMKGERQHFLLRPPRGLDLPANTAVLSQTMETCHLLGENFLSWQRGYKYTFPSVSAPEFLSRLDQLTWRQITFGHAVFLTQFFFPKEKKSLLFRLSWKSEWPHAHKKYHCEHICLYPEYKASLHGFSGTTGYPQHHCFSSQILSDFKTHIVIFRGAENLKQLDIVNVAIKNS